MSFGYKHTYHILWQIIYADDSLLTYEIKKTHIQFMLSSVMWTNNPHGTRAHTYIHTDHSRQVCTWCFQHYAMHAPRTHHMRKIHKHRSYQPIVLLTLRIADRRNKGSIHFHSWQNPSPSHTSHGNTQKSLSASSLKHARTVHWKHTAHLLSHTSAFDSYCVVC